MGVRISGGRLAGHVALAAGSDWWPQPASGSTAPITTARTFSPPIPLRSRTRLRKAYAIAPGGVVGTNCMVAVTNYDEMVRTSCEGGAKVIVSGAGLPLNLPGLTADFPEVALVPIASSVKAAELIARKWHKAFGRLPDAVVVEDPDTAGGHLGEKLEKIGRGHYDQYATVRGVKDYFRGGLEVDIPVIAAGGIWDREDLCRALSKGPTGYRWPAASSAPRSATLPMPSSRPTSTAAGRISGWS